MFRLYGAVAVKAGKLAVRGWMAAVAIPAYAFLFVLFATLLGPVLAPLGPIGGIAIGLFGAACFGGYLSVLALAVTDSRIRLADLKHGLRAVWDVTSVFFAIWIINMVVFLVAAAAGPRAHAVRSIVALAMAIFFNLIPELICHSRNRSIALLQESAQFVVANPFAWFAPNLVFAAVILWATDMLSFTSPGENLMRLAALGSETGVLRFISGSGWLAPLLVVLLHYIMIFRGLLYLELSSGSARMRDFRRRMG